MDSGKREIERTWTASDACGNKADQIQRITIQPIFSDINSDFTKHLTLSFNQTVIHDSIIMGQVSSKDIMELVNCEVGNEDEFDV